MLEHVKNKRQLDEFEVISGSKRRRSSRSSEASASESDLDDGDYSALDTPATPLTPATPATPSRKTTFRPKIHVCTYEGCGKAFNRPVRLEEHMRSHTSSRLFKCPHEPCEKDFLRQSHLSHHIKSAHNNHRDYLCNWEGCDKSFATGTRLRRHQQAHEGREKFRCSAYPPCSQSFRKRATLQRHIDVEHLQLKAFPCTKCKSGFDTASRLRAHETTSHGESRYWCSVCCDIAEVEPGLGLSGHFGGFVTYSELQDHIRLEHPPSCSYCSLACASSRELERHIDIQHSFASLKEPKSFVCPVEECRKSFTKQGNLNIHIKSVHEKEKNFVCGITNLSETHDLAFWDGTNACGQAFGAKASLEAHIRRKHVGGFAENSKKSTRKENKSTLQEMKTPILTKLTGAGYAEEIGRDIACIVSVCPFRFFRQYDLKVHARLSHGMLDDELDEALAEREALSGGRFWIGDFDDDDVPNRLTDSHRMRVTTESEEMELPSHSYRPSCPMRRSQVSKEVDSSRDASPADFDTLGFQALSDFCKPVQDTTEQQSSLIDPNLAQYETNETK